MLKLLLYPFLLIYGFITSTRNFLYDIRILKENEFKIPVISVGNITVGGTGKTPHAEYLLSLLEKEFNVAFLSRGYKRKTKGFILSDINSTFKEIGDEPVQIKQKFSTIPVAVCEKRVNGIEQLVGNNDLDVEVIVLDDAYQHRNVKPHINILLIDYNRPIMEDKLVPVGRLRESNKGRDRANIIIYTKCPDKLQPIDQRIIKNRIGIKPYQDLFFTKIVYGEITPAIKGISLFQNDLKQYKVLLITGIANPSPLIEYLEEIVGTIHHCSFSDHHQFSNKEIESVYQEFESIDCTDKMMITTEKDLVRIRALANLPHDLLNNLYYIPIEIKFLNNRRDFFNKRILNYVTENRSNQKLYRR